MSDQISPLPTVLLNFILKNFIVSSNIIASSSILTNNVLISFKSSNSQLPYLVQFQYKPVKKFDPYFIHNKWSTHWIGQIWCIFWCLAASQSRLLLCKDILQIHVHLQLFSFYWCVVQTESETREKRIVLRHSSSIQDRESISV